MVKTSAGSSGRRRDHRSRWLAPRGRSPVAGGEVTSSRTAMMVAVPASVSAGQFGRRVGRGVGLGGRYRLADRFRARERAGYLLADRQAERLELRDVDVLDAYVGHRVPRRAVRVGGGER